MHYSRDLNSLTTRTFDVRDTVPDAGVGSHVSRADKKSLHEMGVFELSE